MANVRHYDEAAQRADDGLIEWKLMAVSSLSARTRLKSMLSVPGTFQCHIKSQRINIRQVFSFDI